MLNEEKAPADCLDHRRAGVLLHLTSLPGPGPCGSLGPEAHNFVGFLADSGMTVWQMLPVGPTQSDGSPYQTNSIHAGNPRLVALEPLLERGWLQSAPADDSDAAKFRALRLSWDGFRERAVEADHKALKDFIADNAYWIDNYSLFRALGREYRTCWWNWPRPLRDRDPDALERARQRLAEDRDYIHYVQFLFFSQWQVLRGHANAVGVKLFGDMPIFVAHDSAEVWACPGDFDLNEDCSPRVVAGVPPDYFSATGQRWGNPLYRWDAMQADGFRFWLDRIRTQMRLFDMVRIDHFRGFESYWEIPAEEESAINGRWVKALGDELFERLHQRFGKLPLIAEDLGIITKEVDALRKKYRLPGMKVLQFAFSGDPTNPYLPFHHDRDSLVYTGTHDNDTTLGWYLSLDEKSRTYVDEYLGHPSEDMPWPLIRCALRSRSHLAVLPMQDVLGLDGDHRMNLPGTSDGNWSWRFSWDQVWSELPGKILQLVKLYGR
ncbi:MAG: 4-alpha-glucanotransferase [Chromatiaceae bacterium]|jgi:4-alpha-glucanotransferase|nr:4-alpha-glucanotransferase [Chromatiaceae bacterium]